MVVTEIWRYPVKSMGGERLDTAAVTELGITYDRGWGVFNPASGTVLTGRREPKLLLASAAVAVDRLSITTETGAVIEGDIDPDSTDADSTDPDSTDPDSTDAAMPADMSDALSDWLGYRVELRRAGTTGGTYEVPIDIEAEQEWLAWTGPPGAWHDSTKTRLSILSAASTNGIDTRRFRANIIIDGAAQQEDGWVGAEVQIGEADSGVQVAVKKLIDRCVMVARPQRDLGRDLDALRWVVRERANLMGIGALVTKPGHIVVGDEVGPCA